MSEIRADKSEILVIGIANPETMEIVGFEIKIDDGSTVQEIFIHENQINYPGVRFGTFPTRGMDLETGQMRADWVRAYAAGTPKRTDEDDTIQ